MAFILLAYARAAVLLDAKAFWWDESLSLQRAEQALPDLLRGVLWIRDGFTSVPTIDQHPFFSFLLQGGLLRVAGDSEYVLRYGSVMAAALMVPALWVLARYLARERAGMRSGGGEDRRDSGVVIAGPHAPTITPINTPTDAPGGAAGGAAGGETRSAPLPPMTPLLAALLGAINPFLLWYGQEARPYALWAVLAVLTTYLLLRATETERIDRRFGAGFLAAELMFVTTHYYAALLLPLHALILFVWLARRSLARALIAAAALLVVGGIVGAYGAYTIFAQGGGANFASISLAMLVPDLLNAFSLGLSVDLAQVWMVDWLFGLLALAAAIWGLRSRRVIAAGGWILPAFLLLPIGILLVLNEFRPLYMNARHLSLLVGAFVLLTAGGAALVWRWQRSAGLLLTLALVIPIGWSTWNYHTLEEYAKDDYHRFGEYLAGRIMPGDAVLFYPPSSWRIFEYYVPVTAALDKAQAADGSVGDSMGDSPVGIYGIPLLDAGVEGTKAWLENLGERYDRIWVLKSGTHPYFDPDWALEGWLRDNLLRVRDAKFFSHSSLHAELYLPEIPVFTTLPAGVQHPTTAEFGGIVRLAGYSSDEPVSDLLPSQLRLYWQVNTKPERRYKYIVQLVEEAPDGAAQVLGSIEREPYEGDIPTLYWDPGKTILEYVEFPLPVTPAPAGSTRYFTFQMYDAETLEKLPVTQAADGAVQVDDVTVRLP